MSFSHRLEIIFQLAGRKSYAYRKLDNLFCSLWGSWHLECGHFEVGCVERDRGTPHKSSTRVASKLMVSPATHVCLVVFVFQRFVDTMKRNLILSDVNVVSMVLSSPPMMRVFTRRWQTNWRQSRLIRYTSGIRKKLWCEFLRAGDRQIDDSHG
jgi:hypothetical protein